MESLKIDWVLNCFTTKSFKMKRINIKLFVIAVMIPGLLTAGGGWTQPKGHGYFKLSEWWVIGTQHFTDAGKIDPNLTNGIFNTAIYGEYGFTHRLTGIVYFPFFSRAYYNNQISAATGETILKGEAINTIGDADIALKYGLIVNKPLVVSATLQFGLPFGENSGGEEGILQTGDGEFNQLLEIDAGGSFKLGKAPAYASAYLGYNNRSNGYSDEFRFGAELGAGWLNNKLYTTVRLEAIKSTYNGSGPTISDGSTIFANNTEFLAFNPEIAYQITDKWGVSAGIGTALYGKIIYANPSFNVGVFVKW